MRHSGGIHRITSGALQTIRGATHICLKTNHAPLRVSLCIGPKSCNFERMSWCHEGPTGSNKFQQAPANSKRFQLVESRLGVWIWSLEVWALIRGEKTFFIYLIFGTCFFFSALPGTTRQYPAPLYPGACCTRQKSVFYLFDRSTRHPLGTTRHYPGRKLEAAPSPLPGKPK